MVGISYRVAAAGVAASSTGTVTDDVVAGGDQYEVLSQGPISGSGKPSSRMNRKAQKAARPTARRTEARRVA
jgi:hypothetical protein